MTSHDRTDSPPGNLPDAPGRPAPGDDAYGCVAWFAYDLSPLDPERLALRTLAARLDARDADLRKLRMSSATQTGDDRLGRSGMETPLQIAFKNLEPSDALEAAIRKRADKLERHFDRIVSCRVSVEAVSQSRHKGNLYHVGIDLRVPDGEIVVSRDRDRREHEDAYVAIRDAFDSALRQLEEHARKRRG